ncbi:MAG: surface-adhesin E family protein [Pseudomonadota bacterium]|nr:surface-adhesin E family protein [Pseudomonadota bacterium]
MKKLTLFIVLFSTLATSSSSFADWARVGENKTGNTFYVDFQKIRQAEGYIYFWLLNDYGSQSEWGYLSSTAYVQGDCALFRYKNLTWTIYKRPMGVGDNLVSIKPPDEWLYPSSNQSDEIILDIVCKGRN